MSNHYYELNITSTNKKVLEIFKKGFTDLSQGNKDLSKWIDISEPIIERCEHGIDLQEDNCMEECEPENKEE